MEVQSTYRYRVNLNIFATKLNPRSPCFIGRAFMYRLLRVAGRRNYCARVQQFQLPGRCYPVWYVVRSTSYLYFISYPLYPPLRTKLTVSSYLSFSSPNLPLAIAPYSISPICLHSPAKENRSPAPAVQRTGSWRETSHPTRMGRGGTWPLKR